MIDTNWGESDGWVIRNCDVFNNGWVNLYVHATQNGLINNCRIYESPEFNPESDLRIGAGIGLHINPIEAVSYDRGGRIITNHIVVDSVHIENADLRLGRSSASANFRLSAISFNNSNIVSKDTVLFRVNEYPIASEFSNNVLILNGSQFTNSADNFAKMARGDNTYSEFPGAGVMVMSDSINDSPTLHNITGAGGGAVEPPIEPPVEPPVEPPIEPERIPIEGYMEKDEDGTTLVLRW